MGKTMQNNVVWITRCIVNNDIMNKNVVTLKLYLSSSRLNLSSSFNSFFKILVIVSSNASSFPRHISGCSLQERKFLSSFRFLRLSHCQFFFARDGEWHVLPPSRKQASHFFSHNSIFARLLFRNNNANAFEKALLKQLYQLHHTLARDALVIFVVNDGSSFAPKIKWEKGWTLLYVESWIEMKLSSFYSSVRVCNFPREVRFPTPPCFRGETTFIVRFTWVCNLNAHMENYILFIKLLSTHKTFFINKIITV